MARSKNTPASRPSFMRVESAPGSSILVGRSPCSRFATGRSTAARPARSFTSGSARRGSGAPHSPRSPMRPCPNAFTRAPGSSGHAPIQTPLRSTKPSFCRGGVDNANSRAPRRSQAARPTAHGQVSRQHSRMGQDRPRQPIVRDQNRRLTAAAGGTDPATERNPARKAGV
jgi:hypothetical protein